jgi:myo-inositol-1(or 4)-monophosphatase
MAEDNLSELLLRACRAAADCLEAESHREAGQEKWKDSGDPRTIVSEADQRAEASIIDTLRSEIDCCVLAEEAGLSGVRTEHRYRAIIDPLDGTRNYVDRTLGLYGVSIALEEGGDVVAGAICLPRLGETIVGRLGGGVTLWKGDGSSAAVVPAARGARTLRTARVVNGRGGAPPEVFQFPPMAGLFAEASECLNFGACTVALHSVILGRTDALMICSQCYWDFAAGMLLVTELGGHFGVWRDRWSTRATPQDRLGATENSRFDIAASLDGRLFADLTALLAAERI